MFIWMRKNESCCNNFGYSELKKNEKMVKKPDPFKTNISLISVLKFFRKYIFFPLISFKFFHRRIHKLFSKHVTIPLFSLLYICP